MELESEDGTTIPIQFGVETVIGRELGLGFGPSSTDRTVSRRHLSLRLINDPIEKFRAGFEVIGKNPIWVCAEADGGRRIYKNSEKGELRAGDKVSLSLKKPSFWVVKRRGEENEEDEEKRRVLDAVERREKRTLERRREKAVRAKEEVFEDEDDEEIGNVDVSQIDPVKEFGFIVKGHEFDQYPKKKILDPSIWNWFLEEARDNSDDDDDDEATTSSRGKKGRRMKRKKSGKDDDEDEEWTGESEEENVVVVKQGTNKHPKHSVSTRSKDPKRPRNDSSKEGAKVLKNQVEEDDEDDETLGGFIVDEDEDDGGELDDEESEKEFDDEEEDDED